MVRDPGWWTYEESSGFRGGVMRGRSGAGRVLLDRNAGPYLGGVLVSSFGTSAMMLAAGIWAKTLTGSSSLAALTGFCIWAPTMAGPAIGTVADRMRRRTLLIWINACMAALLTVLLAVRSASLVWILFAVLLGYGVSLVLMDAAEAALVAVIVPGELLADVNGLRLTAAEGMKLVAPLAGAGLFARFGGPSVALLDAATFAAAACVFAALPIREQKILPKLRQGWRSEAREGAAFLWRQPGLRRLVIAGGSTMFLGGLNGAVIYAVVDAGLHRSPAFAGALYAVQGAGSIAVGLVAGPLMRRVPERWFAAGGIGVFATGAVLRALPSTPIVLAASAAIGLGLPAVLITALSAVQRQTPETLVGRVAATANMVLFVPNAIALAAGAGLLTLLDHRTILLAVGLAGAYTALYCLMGPRPQSRHTVLMVGWTALVVLLLRIKRWRRRR
jgi:MFS family permease